MPIPRSTLESSTQEPRKTSCVADSGSRSPRGRGRSFLRSRIWKLFRNLALIAIALEVLYVLVANTYLNGDSFHGKLNQRPDHFAIQWGKLRTWIPGNLRIKDVAFVGQGVRDTYFGQISNCVFKVSLPDLFVRRIRCTQFIAEDVDFRLSKTSARGRTDTEELHGFPDIPMLEEVPARQDGKHPGHKFNWDIRVSNIEFHRIRSLWIHPLRFQGQSFLKGSMRRTPDGVLTTEVQNYTLSQGTMLLRGRPAGTQMSVQLRGGIHPVAIDDATEDEILDQVHVELSSEGQLNALELLQSRVGARDEWTPQGEAHYRANIQISKGRYLPGSEVSLDAPEFTFRIKDWKWTGKLDLHDRVETVSGQPTAVLRSEITDLQWMEEGQEPIHLDGARIILESEARNLRLVDRFSDANLKVDLGTLNLPNPKVLNRYLPAGVSGAFQTGSLEWRAEFSRTGDRRFVGELQVLGQRLGARMNEKDYVLDLGLHAHFESDAADETRFHLNKSSLLLTNIQSPALSQRQAENWFGLVEIEHGQLLTQPQWRLETPLQLWLRDTRPIVTLLRAEKDAPSWLRWIPTIHEVRGQCLLNVSTNLVEFRDVAIRGDYTDVRAQLNQSGDQLYGIIYARWGILSLGFDLRTPDRHWTMLAAKRWYERESESWSLPIPIRFEKDVEKHRDP